MAYDEIIGTQEKATSLQIDYALKNLHTALPAKVIDFNPKAQTVALEVLVQKLMDDGQGENFPPLIHVPVAFPRGGGFSVTFPLKKGDEGIVIFSERCIDGWWEDGRTSIPLDFRTHDLSDGLFVPGISSKPRALSDFLTSGIEMRTDDKGTFIRLERGLITIQGDIVHKGNTTQTGKHTASVDVVGAGVSLKNHIHGGVKLGESSTMPPTGG